MKTKLINWKDAIIIFLAALVLFSFLAIGSDKYTYYIESVKETAYNKGQSDTSMIIAKSLMDAGNSCEPFNINFGNQSMALIGYNCVVG